MTREEARDAMCAVVRDAIGEIMPVLYPDLSGEPPKQGRWARVTIRHTSTVKASLANHDGVSRWESAGQIIVQLFTPVGDGNNESDSLASVLVHAFQDASGEVWYRSPTASEVGPMGPWTQVNVTVGFQYDEVR